MTATVGLWTGIMKTVYPENKRMELVERADPFLGMIRKPDEHEGDFIKVPVQTMLTESLGSTIANAVLNDADSDFRGFFATRQPYYVKNNLTRDLLMAARSNKGAFVQGLQKLIGDGAKSLSKEQARQVWREPLGTRGVAADCGTTVVNEIILGSEYDGIWFAPGMVLQLLDPATTLLRDGGATVEVLTVTRTPGQCVITTVEANIGAAIAGAADNDLIIRRGDRLACMAGVEGWNPIVAPAPGDNWFTIDRSAFEYELSGARYPSPGGTLEDIISQGLGYFGSLGATNIDYIFMHTMHFMQLARDASASVRRDKTVKTRETNFGYSALEFVGPHGDCMILPSWAMPFGQVRCTTIDTWKFSHVGGVTEVIKDPIDGKYIRRLEGTDNFTIEQAWLGNLVNESPKDNGVIIL